MFKASIIGIVRTATIVAADIATTHIITLRVILQIGGVRIGRSAGGISRGTLWCGARYFTVNIRVPIGASGKGILTSQ